MEKNKKKKNVLIIFLILLILLVLGLVGYILVDKKLTFRDNKVVLISKGSKSVSKSNKSKQKQNLDVNSRLVQTLYNSVTSDDTSYTKYSIYGTVKDKDYIVSEVSEIDKMGLVKNNLTDAYYNYVSCSSANVPDTLSIDVEGSKLSYFSGCSDNNPDNINYGGSSSIRDRYIKSMYSKKYVETVYKRLFGKDAKLDTSVPITNISYPIAYFYNENLDSYIEYAAVGGTTGAPIQYKSEIEKAELKDATLKIYEKTVTTVKEDDVYDNNGNIEKYGDTKNTTDTYVYTFLRESDGMYKFVSRIKESK